MSEEELFDTDEELDFDTDEELDSDTDEELDSDFEEAAVAPKKKRSKLKWLFFLLLLILVAAAALVGLNKLGYVNLPLDDYFPVEKLFEGSSDTIRVEPGDTVAPVPLPPPPEQLSKEKANKEAERIRNLKMKGKYYLKMGSCLYKACRKELGNRIKLMKLPLVTQKSIQSTTYYELLSETNYLKKRAEEKLRLLNKYNETIGFPYLLPYKKGRFVISFGQFPQEANAIQMKSQLEHLYPQIRLRFLIRPRKDRVAITKYYVGPYNKATAEKVKMKLRDDSEFEWIEITKFR